MFHDSFVLFKKRNKRSVETNAERDLNVSLLLCLEATHIEGV